MQANRLKYFRSPGNFLYVFFSILVDSITNRLKVGSDKIKPDFAEKIMLSVTGVLKCSYCNYLHTKIALEKGISGNEITELLGGEYSNVPAIQAPALLYAQHWADTDGKVSPEARKNLYKHYGKDIGRDIEMHIKMVYFGNMSGNTVEIRKQGTKSNFTFKENIAYFSSLPVAFFIRKAATAKKKD